MPTFHIQQFGCRATQADGAALERQLRDRGYSAASDSGSAEIIVINTCTVTAAADSQARDAIRKMHAQNPQAQVIVTGCYAQRAPEELSALPGVSWVVGNSHKPQIPNLITALVEAQHAAPELARSSASLGTSFPSDVFPAAALQAGHSAELDPAQAGNDSRQSAKILTGNIFAQSVLLAAPVLGGEGNHTRPTLKIQDGCNSRCSYCVIPFVRGRSRSLPPPTVIAEIARLANAGYKEVVLSGINLGTYGRDLASRVEFTDLLRRILDETSIERLRISSIEPLDVTQDLIDLFATNDRIAQHFHMPLQSGANRLLAAMHRWYRAEHYARRVQLIHDRLPHAAIGADVITGFPGETEADHAATMSFIESLPFTYLHVFSFSKRPGTKAASLANEVPPAAIKNRARQLRALSGSKSCTFRRSQAGRTLRVLTLRAEEHDAAHTPALSSSFLNVSVSGKWPANQWLDVRISEEMNGLPGQAENHPASFALAIENPRQTPDLSQTR
ncbi:MAG TPA: tRNA (N(6)-L-threonylcarbamoyladenosine(37)-C(2))-methylthiotransferase MtaB [Candidatus Saccharimonadales bacterium]|nr:tRNA (N(6)-L-threonylcarbamoyladenosine(37)-C(2))-methylthiotransferase MtaB [Candidatus Saccharimonadales bacterium]